MPASPLQPARAIARILRVDHAGEHGAVHIYERQLRLAAAKFPDLVPWLTETLSHELRHRSAFASAMPSRNAKPCRLLGVWSVGGALLGALTAALGRTGIMVCTAAVERIVHRHLIEQIAFLDRWDPALADTVRGILAEEIEHLAYASAHIDARSLAARALDGCVAIATETLIFISTRGDSLHLRRALA
jgi:ubiquinone biosynthesis monooxygenase Coq7